MHDPLIDVATLEATLDANGRVVIDARFDLADPQAGGRRYLEAHVAGAVHAHLDRDLSAPRADAICGGRHPLPSREGTRARLAALGVADDSDVVVYDDAGGMFAARVWWLLRWIGHERVAVLDGGWAAWTAIGGDVRSGAEHRPPGTLSARAPLVRIATVDEVSAAIESLDRLIVDARAPDRFDGSNETIDPVAGHIPGAVNAFFRQNLDADGRFRPADALRERFASLAAGRPVIHQCGSGVTACHNVLAMSAAGLDPGALYAGSWSEWIEDPARPVATGRA